MCHGVSKARTPYQRLQCWGTVRIIANRGAKKIISLSLCRLPSYELNALPRGMNFLSLKDWFVADIERKSTAVT